MMLEQLLELDRELFSLLNGQWHNSFFDALLPYWREKLFWVPLYLALAAFAFYRFRLKALYFILAVALTVGLADTISSKGLKKNVQRLRPCQDSELQAEVRLLVGCGRSYSFTSSHAANHFALSAFIALVWGRLFRRIRWPLMLWAGSIAYAQVYVGVHYPLDVIMGGLLGALVGIVMAKLYLRLRIAT
jgi:membrane-associated phospholipid phosphatase